MSIRLSPSNFPGTAITFTILSSPVELRLLLALSAPLHDDEDFDHQTKLSGIARWHSMFGMLAININLVSTPYLLTNVILHNRISNSYVTVTGALAKHPCHLRSSAIFKVSDWRCYSSPSLEPGLSIMILLALKEWPRLGSDQPSRSSREPNCTPQKISELFHLASSFYCLTCP